MKFLRRDFLRLATGAAALAGAPGVAWALDYPARPVHVLVGYGAGSAPDILTRLVFQGISEHTSSSFVIENRPGVGTNLAAEAVVRAPPDGYTLLTITLPTMISSLLYSNLPYDFVHDIAPVACICGTPFVVVVNPSVPAKTIPEFIAYAKANPGKIIMASQGTGTLTHLAGELFKMMAQVDLLHVPYHGEMEAQVDLLSGRAQVMFDPVVTSLPNVDAGKLRALAVTTVTRLDSLPGVPTVAEFVPGYEVEGWIGVGAPKDTPTEIVSKLNLAVNASLADPAVAKRLAELGSIAHPVTPDGYRKLIGEEIKKYGDAIKFANIKAG